MNNTTMTPVTLFEFCRAIDYGVKMMHEMVHDINCALHFSTEFGEVAMLRKLGCDITMGILINHKPVALFDYTNDGVGNKYWSKRGEGQYSYWSKIEIYDYAMGLAKLAGKEAAK